MITFETRYSTCKADRQRNRSGHVRQLRALIDGKVFASVRLPVDTQAAVKKTLRFVAGVSLFRFAVPCIAESVETHLL